MSLEGELSRDQVETSTGDFTVWQIFSSSSLWNPIILQVRAVQAVVDTAAMVTFIFMTKYTRE